ncbi:hypothetical protein BDK51DRAFT_40702 [Blyttiomyces helicus]|uniref:Uncharacterized protein n=1 Tax=Blyttiomyces helicus TaxID=388810 RepID=A0A4P9WFB2_9FUNG|nr:hypothetical protein BDK51DRAFT_40702 [Blyttiomyces helicus]|eukprot:RKO89710.1 hypothetical protein BDK51DRAFT_40702 [Blyttiomyces helicus]
MIFERKRTSHLEQLIDLTRPSSTFGNRFASHPPVRVKPMYHVPCWRSPSQPVVRARTPDPPPPWSRVHFEVSERGQPDTDRDGRGGEKGEGSVEVQDPRDDAPARKATTDRLGQPNTNEQTNTSLVFEKRDSPWNAGLDNSTTPAGFPFLRLELPGVIVAPGSVKPSSVDSRLLRKPAACADLATRGNTVDCCLPPLLEPLFDLLPAVQAKKALHPAAVPLRTHPRFKPKYPQQRNHTPCRLSLVARRLLVSFP